MIDNCDVSQPVRILSRVASRFWPRGDAFWTRLGDAGGFPSGELVLHGEPDTVLTGVLVLNEPARAAGEVLRFEGSGGAGGAETGKPFPDTYHMPDNLNIR